MSDSSRDHSIVLPARVRHQQHAIGFVRVRCGQCGDIGGLALQEVELVLEELFELRPLCDGGESMQIPGSGSQGAISVTSGSSLFTVWRSSWWKKLEAF